MPDRQALIAEVLQRPYHWIIQPSEDGVAASVLEFPGCYSGGDTPEEATTELRDAIAVWVEGELDAGRDIPEPIDPERASGRLTMRIPPSLHYQAQLRAQLEGVSLNRLLSDAVASYVGVLTARSGGPAAPTPFPARPSEPATYEAPRPRRGTATGPRSLREAEEGRIDS